MYCISDQKGGDDGVSKTYNKNKSKKKKQREKSKDPATKTKETNVFTKLFKKSKRSVKKAVQNVEKERIYQEGKAERQEKQRAECKERQSARRMSPPVVVTVDDPDD